MSSIIDVPTETSPVNRKPSGEVLDLSTRMNRRTSIDSVNILETNLKRCLTTFDITLLALGHMLGSGVYVLISSEAKNVAGPAIVLSFFYSGFASFLCALCYAELGVRYPKAGSAYSYTYLALGEIWAFMVGWNMALEYVISTAAIARACSSHIDSLTGGAIKAATQSFTGPVHAVLPVEYLDFFALLILIIIVICLSFGVRITFNLNNVISSINLAVLVVLIGVGFYFADIKNWNKIEAGGFMPFGFSGVLSASASCFYAFIGFDSIATASEETNMPQKAIPRATCISMGIATLTYILVASVLTLMVNYRDITGDSGLPDALSFHGAEWARYLVVFGGVCGMTTAIVSIIFAMSRVVYNMAADGLLLSFCSTLSPRTRTPLRTMYLFTFLAGVFTLFLEVSALIELMSIGAIVAYLVVSMSVIILRYKPPLIIKPAGQELETINEEQTTTTQEDPAGQLKDEFKFLMRYKFFPRNSISKAIAFFLISNFALCGFTRGCYAWIADGTSWAVFLFIFLILCIASSLILMILHHQSNIALRYKVPLSPLIPALTVIFNTILLVNLHILTWIRLAVWLAVGLAIYFAYGMEHSKLDVAMRNFISMRSNRNDNVNVAMTNYNKRHSSIASNISVEYLLRNLNPGFK